jgi:hypothetical protein
VKDRLDEVLESIPRTRLLLIKPRPAVDKGRIEFMFVQANETDPFYHTFQLERYEDLLSLDIPALLAGEPSQHAQAGREPFYLVCTNGKRDPCCARYGQGVFETLSGLGNGSVWQCSHVDGHRFAANVLLFPYGIYYGRLRPEIASDLYEAGAAGRMALAHYRGRACYDPVVQAGEALLRAETGVLELGAYRLLGQEQIEGTLWQVRFASRADGQVHRLAIRSSQSAGQIYISCRGDKQAPMVSYQLESYRIEQ